MIRRLAVALAMIGFFAGCGSDGETAQTGAQLRTTVPTTTAEVTTTTLTSDDQPDDTEHNDAPTTTDTTPPSTTLPDGDLTQARIALEPLGRFNQPIDAVVAPNGEWWVAERPGQILVVDPTTGVTGDLVLDLSEGTQAQGERGLLGLAIDDEALYVNYTDLAGTTRIDALLLDESGRPGDAVRLLEIEQPFSNHNGGSLAIGPDGHLYVGVGDGGAADDPLGAGQDPDQILGSIVRIDPTPTAAEPYTIPADNPFATGGGVAEIFLTGVRNPWRMAFDEPTSDLWVADVGQNTWEEVTLLLGANGWGVGANLGWNLREGTERFAGDRPDNNVDPVFVYGHQGTISGCSITGGEVYRGTAIPALRGAYVFGDFCTARLWAVSVTTGDVVFHDLDASMPGGQLVDFAALPDGELVAMSLNGEVVRLVPG